MFISFHLNKGYYSFNPRGEHIEHLLTTPNDKPYKVVRLRQNYYYNSKTGKISRSTKELGESFISFDNGATFIRLPWFIPSGSETFYLAAVEQNLAKMKSVQLEQETQRRISEATFLEVA